MTTKYTYALQYKNIEEEVTTMGDISKYQVILNFISKHGLNKKRGFKSWDVICELIEKDDKTIYQVATN